MDDLKTRVSKLMSYLLRHDPQDLKMDKKGFVKLNDLLEKVREYYPKVNRELLVEIVERSERKRFEIIGDRIRALYGHSIHVDLHLEEDRKVKVLYHGTTLRAAKNILKEGLRPMDRKWVHLSASPEIAIEVGKRRSKHPIILRIDAKKAREDGVRFYKATKGIYLCKYVPPKYIELLTSELF